ncbi:MAG: fumarylacetoacetate hydrolase, partial [Actinobacteria bacterium]
MKLLSYDGGFGRVEDGAVVPMGIDLVRFLATGTAQTGATIPLTSVRPRAPVPRPGKVICVG